jgi:hypothetical protein
VRSHRRAGNMRLAREQPWHLCERDGGASARRAWSRRDRVGSPFDGAAVCPLGPARRRPSRDAAAASQGHSARTSPQPSDAGSKDAALAIAYKLLDAAQDRWRMFNGAELVKELLDGTTFKDGIKVTNDETTTYEGVAA